MATDQNSKQTGSTEVFEGAPQIRKTEKCFNLADAGKKAYSAQARPSVKVDQAVAKIPSETLVRETEYN
jgi:hypothetical protein